MAGLANANCMQDQDFDFFVNNMPKLYSAYGHKFLAIKESNILGAYDTFNEALETTLKTDKLGTFLIQECFDSVEKMVNHFQGNVAPDSTNNA
jgi:hypothetical protein